MRTVIRKVSENVSDQISRHLATAIVALGASLLTITGNWMLAGTSVDRQTASALARMDAKIENLTEQVSSLQSSLRNFDQTSLTIAVVQVKLETTIHAVEKHERELEQLRESLVPDSMRQVRSK